MIKTNLKPPYIRTIIIHCYSVMLFIKFLIINTGKYLQYIWHYVSLPLFKKMSFIFMLPPLLLSPTHSLAYFLGTFLPWFCSVMCFMILSDSLHLFFVPLADVSFLCPKSGRFSFPFFIRFLSLLLADRWGDMLFGTENVMERFSSHPTMRTGCSCNISLQIEGERSGVPNGTFPRLLLS